jgi:hypothetical protein
MLKGPATHIARCNGIGSNGLYEARLICLRKAQKKSRKSGPSFVSVVVVAKGLPAIVLLSVSIA